MAELEARTAPTASSDLPTWMNDPAVLDMLDGLGVDPYQAAPNFNLWFDTVKEIESSGGWNTYNPFSSARGPYQILKGSYPVMLRRAIRAYKKADVEPPKWMTDALADKDRDPADLSEDEVRRLIMFDIQQRPQKNKEGVGTDKLIADLANGNWDAGQDLYLDHHHTDRTDQPTLERSNEKFAEVEDQVVVPFKPEPLGPKALQALEQFKQDPSLLKTIAVDATPVPESYISSGLLKEIETPQRAGRFPEVTVDAQRVDPTPPPLPELQEVVPTQRGQIPIPQKPTVQEVTVPQRAGRFPEIDVTAQRVDETPPPLPELEEVVPTQRGQVPIPKKDIAPKVIEAAKELKSLYEEMDKLDPKYRKKTLREVDVPDRPLKEAEVKAQPVQERPPEVDLATPTEKDTTNPAISPKALAAARELQSMRNARGAGLATELGEGLTLGLLGEIVAGGTALTSDKSYARAKAEYEVAREEFKATDPAAAQFSIPLEIAGSLPTGSFLYKGLTKAGMGLVGATATEGGLYMAATGEGFDDRLARGVGGAAFGAAFGRLFQGISNPANGKLAKTPEELFELQANANAKAISGAKIARPTADITDDELATQLLIRETEYLSDVIARQGRLPQELGTTFYQRMAKYAEDMGISGRQYNKVIRSDKAIKNIRALIDERGAKKSLEELNVLRQELLDRVSSFVLRDGAKTVPEAQSIIARYRQFVSPTSTLAETMVGNAFAQRIIRAMNRVTREQVYLDKMWKGMEPFRQLAQNPKFNDAMHDAVNAENIGEAAALQALQKAKNMAVTKIGKGADVRLQQFIDDAYEFNKRYRTEVTSGVLSNVWMHSTPTLIMRDVGLKRPMAAGKAKDAASKVRSRKTMAEWRKAQAAKPPEKQLDMANIFDSHWTWQRQSLTRMELGAQLGLRTHGKPLEALTPSQIQKRKAAKKAKKKGASDLEATARFEEGGTLKLFDEKIIEESLKRQGYSPLQIKNAISIIDNLGVDANKAMSAELDMVRSLGYVGTIANPYGALMNVHDLFNASFELGIGNVLRSLFSKEGIQFSPSDMGLARQVFGEFVRKARRGETTTGNQFLENLVAGSADLLDWSMKWSGFAKLDRFGKSKIMGASFNRAKQDIANGSFDTKWQYSFSRGELDQLKRDILAGAETELVRDLVMFDLFKLQPINAAAQTSFGLANPNARIMYMLKGFAIKQLDLLERRIVGEWRSGNKEQALKNAAKYLVISGGGYGLVNESRQVLKGEAPDAEQAAWSALYQVGSVITLGAMGANDYGYDKFMNDPANAMLSNLFPPVTATFPAAVLKDMAETVRTGDPIPNQSIKALPLVGKIADGVINE